METIKSQKTTTKKTDKKMKRNLDKTKLLKTTTSYLR